MRISVTVGTGSRASHPCDPLITGGNHVTCSTINTAHPLGNLRFELIRNGISALFRTVDYFPSFWTAA